MQPNAIIFHGTGADPQTAWYPWLGSQLSGRGYAVAIPHYPGMNVEPVATLLPKALADHDFDENTVLVGHSGGAAFLLALLQHIDATVAQAILVAGYLYFITSVEDPYGCDAGQGRAMFDRLGGTQIIRNEGHFGDYGQPFPTFELVDRLIG